MSASGVIVCRLFSGPHLGAELVLPAGKQVIGTDDSCDVILQDGSIAPRHAVLDIAFTDEEAVVRVAPLDGEVLLDDRPLPPEGAAVAERTPFFLGLTCFAWAPPETSAEAWRQVATGLQEKRAAVEAPAEKADAVPGPEEPLLLDEVADASAAGPANDVGEHGWRRLRRLPPRRLLLLLLALLAVAGLTFSYEGRLPDASVRAEEMRALIQGKGFAGIDVVPMGQGVGLRGMLEDDADRAALLNLARSVHYPVYLDIKVRGDRAEAVASAFASRGFALAVQERTDEPGGLEVAGYMRDGTVEEEAFSSVREDIPALRGEAVWTTLQRTIRHAADVEAALLPRLREAGLSFVQVRCGRGKVRVAGTFDTEQRARLDALLDAAREELGVPVVFEVAASFDKPRQAGRGGQPPEKAASAPQTEGPSAPADDLSSLRVTSVTLTPMRFISLGGGQRIFEGGQLPGGYVLESVGVKELKLRKDGRVILYPLRGPHE